MVFEKVCEIISEQMNISTDKIKMSTTFTDDLGCDSLDVFQIVSELEEAFDIEFSNEDAEKVKAISDAVKYIEDRIDE